VGDQRLTVHRDFALAEVACERKPKFGAAPDCFRRHAAPQQLRMRLARGLRQDAHVFELEILAREAEALAGPRAFQGLDRLARPAEALLARDLKTVELLVAIAEAKAQPQTAVRNHVD